MVSKVHIFNALDAIRSIVVDDLQPIFSDLSPEYAPVSSVTLVDWITYIKSSSFDPSSPSFDSAGFSDFIANSNNINALYADKVAFNLCLNSAVTFSLFFNSKSLCTLPLRDVSITAFNAETMTGKIYVVAWKPFYSIAESPTVYWELRIRSTNASMLRVYRHLGQEAVFNPIKILMDKVKLGCWYSYNSAYLYEDTSLIRILDV